MGSSRRKHYEARFLKDQLHYLEDGGGAFKDDGLPACLWRLSHETSPRGR